MVGCRYFCFASVRTMIRAALICGAPALILAVAALCFWVADVSNHN